MKTNFLIPQMMLVVSLVGFTSSIAFTQDGKTRSYKPRIINTTDLGADPDDEQSMVRQLVCANEFDIEGLIVATGCWKKNQSNIDMLDKILDAYAKVYSNLSVHADGFPTPDDLNSISIMGQGGYGMSDVGTGNDSLCRFYHRIKRSGFQRPGWQYPDLLLVFL